MLHYPFLWHLDATQRNTEECLSIVNGVDARVFAFSVMTRFDKDDTFHTEPSASLISPLNETDHNEQGWNPDHPPHPPHTPTPAPTTETHTPPSICVHIPAFSQCTSLPSLTPTHHVRPCPSFSPSLLQFPLPSITSLTWQAAHLGLIQQSQMPASFSSAATLLLLCAHIHTSPASWKWDCLGFRLCLSPTG